MGIPNDLPHPVIKQEELEDDTKLGVTNAMGIPNDWPHPVLKKEEVEDDTRLDTRFYTVAESSLRAQELSSLKTEARIFQQQVMEFGVKLAAKHVQIIIFEVCSSDRQRSRDKDAFDAALNAATDVFEQEGEESERGEQMYMDAIMKGTTLFPEAQAELWEFWQRRELWMVWRRGGWLL